MGIVVANTLWRSHNCVILFAIALCARKLALLSCFWMHDFWPCMVFSYTHIHTRSSSTLTASNLRKKNTTNCIIFFVFAQQRWKCVQCAVAKSVRRATYEIVYFAVGAHAVLATAHIPRLIVTVTEAAYAIRVLGIPITISFYSAIWSLPLRPANQLDDATSTAYICIHRHRCHTMSSSRISIMCFIDLPSPCPPDWLIGAPAAILFAMF